MGGSHSLVLLILVLVGLPGCLTSGSGEVSLGSQPVPVSDLTLEEWVSNGSFALNHSLRFQRSTSYSMYGNVEVELPAGGTSAEIELSWDDPMDRPFEVGLITRSDRLAYATEGIERAKIVVDENGFSPGRYSFYMAPGWNADPPLALNLQVEWVARVSGSGQG